MKTAAIVSGAATLSVIIYVATSFIPTSNASLKARINSGGIEDIKNSLEEGKLNKKDVLISAAEVKNKDTEAYLKKEDCADAIETLAENTESISVALYAEKALRSLGRSHVTDDDIRKWTEDFKNQEKPQNLRTWIKSHATKNGGIGK